VPWERDPPGFGFTSGKPWLPIPDAWTEHAVAAGRAAGEVLLATGDAGAALPAGSAAWVRTTGS
jgi:hypothetical protein